MNMFWTGVLAWAGRMCQRRGLAAGVLVVALTGCASGPAPSPHDPLESMNRGVFRFNETLDATVVKPVATGYVAILPRMVRTGVNNFFSNLGDVWSLVNNVLQAKPRDAGDSFFRFGVNSLIGLGGVLDVASEMGIERHREDFGQTLGRWGVPPGPYLVLPLLGSSTLRDAVSWRADTLGNPVSRVDHVPTRNTLVVLNLVDARAGYLRAGDVVDEAALDKYSFRRDAYLQKRRNDAYDGAPPEQEAPAPAGAAGTRP